MNVKVNGHVRILSEKEESVNRYARVTMVTDTGVYVTNMNMPHVGTFSHQFFTFDEIEVVR